MPRLRTPNCRPPEPRQRLTEELRAVYGGALTLTNVMGAIGAKRHETALKWIKTNGLEAVTINNRKKWLASDVARALDNSKAMNA